MFGLSTLQIICLAAAAYLGYTYLYPNSGGSLLDTLKGFFAKFNSAPVVNGNKPVVADGSPTTVEIVQRWESLRDVLHTAGLTDAEQELDELWKLLSPKAKKETL